jgi:hypothetical protein
MGAMWKSARVVVAVTVVGVSVAIGLSGCGGADVKEPPGAPATTAAAPGPLTITVTRTGGIAGVNEMVVIDASGNWTYTDQRQGKSQKGQFTAAQMAQLGQAALDPRLAQEVRDKATTVCSDAFQYDLTVAGQTYRFEDCGQARPAVQAVLAAIAEVTPL